MQIPGSWEQADLFRLKCQRMADELRAVREELQVFETKRPMAKMLLRELGNMREAARLADAQGALAPFTSTAPRLVGELRALADEDPEHADEQESEFSRARADVQALQDQLALLEMKSLRRQEHLVDLRRDSPREAAAGGGRVYGPVPSATARAAAAAAAAAVAAAGLAAVAAAAAAGGQRRSAAADPARAAAAAAGGGGGMAPPALGAAPRRRRRRRRRRAGARPPPGARCCRRSRRRSRRCSLR